MIIAAYILYVRRALKKYSRRNKSIKVIQKLHPNNESPSFPVSHIYAVKLQLSNFIQPAECSKHNGPLIPARVPAAASITRVDIRVYAQTVLVLVLALAARSVVRDATVAAPSPLRISAGVAPPLPA